MDKRSRKDAARRETERREASLHVPPEKRVYLLRQHHSDEPGGPRSVWFKDSIGRETFDSIRHQVAAYPREGWSLYEVQTQKTRRERPVTDFVYWVDFCLFSDRATQILRELIEPCGILLPLTSNDGVFWLFRLDAVVDALDTAATSASWMHAPGVQGLASSIYSWAFLTDRLGDQQIFRVPQHYSRLVLNDFAERVRSTGLHGFNLQSVWPNARMAKQ